MQFIAEHCHTMQFSIFQYSVLVNFAAKTNTEIHTNREVSYQMLLQFLKVYMFNDAVLCLL